MKPNKFNKILVVDDDRASNFLTSSTLEEMDVADEVIQLHSGRAALEFLKGSCEDKSKVKQDCPDLILLDNRMPGMNGAEFLAAFRDFRKDHPAIHTSVVILSTALHEPFVMQMNQLGAVACLEKPLTEADVTELVQQLGQP